MVWEAAPGIAASCTTHIDKLKFVGQVNNLRPSPVLIGVKTLLETSVNQSSYSVLTFQGVQPAP